MLFYKREPWQVRIPAEDWCRIIFDHVCVFIVAPAFVYGFIAHGEFRGQMVLGFFPMALCFTLAGIDKLLQRIRGA